MKKILKEISYYLEVFTRTDMKYLSHGSFWLGAGHLVSTTAAFLLSVLLANLLSPTDFGIYRYVITILTFIVLTSLPGCAIVIHRAVAVKNYSEISSATKIHWLGSFFSVFVTAIVGIYYLYREEYTLGIIFVTIAPFVFLFTGGALFAPILSGSKKFKALSFYSTIIITTSSIIIGTVVYFFTTPLAAVLAYVASYGLTRMISSYFSFRKITHVKSSIFETLKRSIEFTSIRVLRTIADHIDQIVIWQLLGPASLATYFIAKLPLSQTLGFTTKIDTLAFPKIATTDVKTLKRTLPLKIVKFSILTIPFVVLLIVLIPFIIPLLFPNYPDAVLLSQLLIPLLIFRPRSILLTVFKAHQKIKYSHILISVVAIVLSVSNFIFIPMYGIYGAVISLYIAQICNSITSILLFRRMH